jgi:hypothetical protein
LKIESEGNMGNSKTFKVECEVTLDHAGHHHYAGIVLLGADGGLMRILYSGPDDAPNHEAQSDYEEVRDWLRTRFPDAFRIHQVLLAPLHEMVVVFDERGEQLPEYQGPYEAVKEKILAVYDGEWERFVNGEWEKFTPGKEIHPCEIAAEKSGIKTPSE